MLKVVVSLGALALTFLLGVMYVPSFAQHIPHPNLVQEVAAPCMVVISLIAVMLWRPKDMPD
jgi:NADH:ubiquinone oxidoreductase subunit 6 (subunit J)